MALQGNPENGKPGDGFEALARLTGRLEELAATLRSLEIRVEALEARREEFPSRDQEPPWPEPETPPPAETAGDSTTSTLVLGLLGRVFLTLAGAFFIRALTDGGKLPPLGGVLLGLGYAAAWAFVADRAGTARRALAATFFTLTSAGIAFPLLWEATTKFLVFTPPIAALALLGMSGLLLAVAWRRALQAVAWIVVLAAIGTGFALMVATSAIQTFAAFFTVLGIAVLWLTYGRRWAGLRWPTALAANASVLILGVLAAWPGGPPEAYRGLSVPLALLQCLGLVLLYLGSFALRTLQRNRAVILFEEIQTALVLLVGFGGAVRIAAAWGAGTPLLGVSALFAGAACYGVALAFVDRQAESGKNFLFYTTLALVFALAGMPILLAGPSLSVTLALAGVLAGLFGIRFGRATLHAHSVVYLAGAALTSGYLAHGLAVFLGPPERARQGFGLAELPLLIALGATRALMLACGDSKEPHRRRIPSLLLSALTVFGLGAYAVTGLSRALPWHSPDAGAMAALRTGVLSLAAILLAGLFRVFAIPEYRWLVFPILGATGLKLLLVDLPQGRPLTLFPALTLFGAALIFAPRLLRREDSDAKGKDS